MDVLANLLIDRRYSDEAGESLSNPRKPTVAKHRGNFAVPVSRPCHVSAMNRAQSVDERLTAGNEARQFIGTIFSLARRKVDGAQKYLEIPLHQSCNHRVHDSENSDAREFADRANVLENADHGSLRLVNPWAQAGIAAVVMREFVGEHGAEL